MEEAGIIGYIGNLVIGFTPERYIGNPVIKSCCSELGRKERRQPSQTCTISHHANTMSCLILFLSWPILHAALMPERPRSPAYMTCQQGALTHNHHTHAIGSQIKYTSVLYKYRPGKGINNINFWSLVLKIIKGSQPWSFINLRKSG